MDDVQVKFEARSQKETESLDDYTEYFEDYCDALGVSDDFKLRLFSAYLNNKCRKRARLVKNRLQSWGDVLTLLLRRRSREEKKVARRKLENRMWKAGEEFEDYAVDCLQLAQRAIPDNEEVAESIAIDRFINGLPEILLDRAEQFETDDIMELAEYVSSQAEKLKNRGLRLSSASSSNQ